MRCDIRRSPKRAIDISTAGLLDFVLAARKKRCVASEPQAQAAKFKSVEERNVDGALATFDVTTSLRLLWSGRIVHAHRRVVVGRLPCKHLLEQIHEQVATAALLTRGAGVLQLA